MLSQFPFLMISCYSIIRFCNFLSLVLILSSPFLVLMIQCCLFYNLNHICFKIIRCSLQTRVTPACGLYFTHFCLSASFMYATSSGDKGRKGEAKDKCFHPSLSFSPCKAWLGGRAHGLACGLITDECWVQWAFLSFSYELSQPPQRSVPQGEGCCQRYSFDIDIPPPHTHTQAV